MNREFLMLAKLFNPKKHRVAGMYVSEKYDGQRCLWDGGVSRGLPKNEIPWANTDKDERYREEQICTGLWSRYGNVIHAPDWWLDRLPEGIFLDGELYLDRGRFQDLRRITGSLSGDWAKVRFLTFDMPAPQIVFMDGRINNPNFKKEIRWSECSKLIQPSKSHFFREIAHKLSIKQTRLPSDEEQARAIMYDMLEIVTREGGEGLMLRDPESFWYPKRIPQLLKVKKMLESEAIVVGYVAGKGRLSDTIGAITVQWNSKTFNISGFTDDERHLAERIWPIGSTIRFRYAGLTDLGIPREARYAR